MHKLGINVIIMMPFRFMYEVGMEIIIDVIHMYAQAWHQCNYYDAIQIHV